MKICDVQHIKTYRHYEKKNATMFIASSFNYNSILWAHGIRLAKNHSPDMENISDTRALAKKSG
jgi:hypothetical protein